MLDPLLRGIKDRIFDPIAERIGLRISPNTITLAGFLVGLGVFVALLGGAHGWALILWGLNRAFDALDGAVARVHHRQTDFGGYLDLLLDFVIYALIPIGVLLCAPRSVADLWAGVFLLATFYVNSASWMYLSAILEKRPRLKSKSHQSKSRRSESHQTVVQIPEGVIGGTETIMFYTALILLPQHFAPIAWTMGALVALGLIQRLVWGLRVLHD